MFVSRFKLILARAYFGHSARASAPATTLMFTFSLCPLGGSLEMENAPVPPFVYLRKGRLSPRIISNPINSAQLPLLPFRGQRRSI